MVKSLMFDDRYWETVSQIVYAVLGYTNGYEVKHDLILGMFWVVFYDVEKLPPFEKLVQKQGIPYTVWDSIPQGGHIL